MVHRDISSDNIILPGGDVRKAKIVDFGIARAAKAAEGTIIGGGFAGKYKYVSPEQVGLYGGEVTPKSDIYSFGLVVAEALRGQPLDMGGSQLDVIEKRRKVPDLTGIEMSLRPLLTAMLAPNPADRPENMAEIASWGEGLTVLRPEPAPPAPPPPVAKPRGGARAIVAALVVVALLGGGAAVYLLRERLGLVSELEHRTDADAAADVAAAADANAESVAHSHAAAAACADPFAQRSRANVIAFANSAADRLRSRPFPASLTSSIRWRPNRHSST